MKCRQNTKILNTMFSRYCHHPQLVSFTWKLYVYLLQIRALAYLTFYVTKLHHTTFYRRALDCSTLYRMTLHRATLHRAATALHFTARHFTMVYEITVTFQPFVGP